MSVSTKTVPWTLLALIAAGLSAGGRTRAQQAASPIAPQLYSHGGPTGDEQYLLEQLNRARLDPAAEGQRIAALLRTPAFASTVSFYRLDPDAVAAQLAAFPAVPPLAFNAKLIAAARAHASDLAPHDGVVPGGASDPLNDHNGYDGSTANSRVAAAGYAGAAGSFGGGCIGENFDPGSDTPDTIHAGYLVDWGNPGFGHRTAALAGQLPASIGIGLAAKPAALRSAFPLVETEDFGWPGVVLASGKMQVADEPALLVGVAYTDANGNGQYDPGEGVAGVTVTMDGGAYYALTSASGGYAFPLVNADGGSVLGTATVRMSGAALGGDRVATVTVALHPAVNGNSNLGNYRANVKWDAVVNAVANPGGGGGTGLVPPADGSTLLAFKGGGIVSKAAGSKVAVTVQRAAKDLSQPLTVAYKQKGTAVSGMEDKGLPGSVTILAGADHAAFKVKALRGGAADGPTALILKVSKAAGVAVQAGGGKATVVINP